MAWTRPTAVFFAVIGAILLAMTIWELVSPGVSRVGILRLATTRGDRLFVGLLGSAFIHLAWLFLFDGGVGWALAASIAWILAVMRWG